MQRKGERTRSLDSEVVRLILVVLIIAGLVQLGLFGFSISRKFTALENENTRGDFERSIAAIEAEKLSLTELTRDYAGWDETRAYELGTYPTFADEVFTESWVDVSKLDHIMMVSPEAVVLWSGIRSKGGFGPIDRDAPNLGYLRPGSVIETLKSSPKTPTPLLSFQTTEIGILLACSFPVTSSDYSAPPLGWVVFARSFDERMLARISERSGLQAKLLDKDGGAAKGQILRLGAVEGRYFDVAADRHLQMPILDATGSRIALLEASKARQLDEPALQLMMELALSLALAATLTALVLLPLLRGLAVGPLVRIARHLDLRAEGGHADLRLEMGGAAGRRDEIGVVADRIDSLLEGLESKRVELEAVNTELAQLARYDHLTGLANRRSFDDYAAREVRRLSRNLRGENNKGSIALLLADIDHFKLYNDRYGHLTGDNCLRSVAETLAKTARRPSDLPCRFGGEEFIVLLPETGIEGARAVAEGMLKAVLELRIPHEDSPVLPYVTLSIGIAASSVHEGFDLGKLIERADAAMYLAKKAGRNQAITAE